MGGTQSKEKKILLIGGAVAIGGLIGFGVYKSQQTTTTTPTTSQEQFQSTEVKSAAVPQAAAAQADESKVAQKIKVEYSPNSMILTFPTIIQILEHSLELMSQDYVQLTVANRAERRRIRTTKHDQYEQLVLYYNEEIENLIEKSQQNLCNELGISVDQFQESVMALMERGYFQQFFMIQASLRQKIKEKIPPTKEVGIQQTKEIIKFQLGILKNKPQQMVKLIDKLAGDQETAQLIPLAINTLIADMIYTEYGIEEEDQIKTITNPSILQDQQMQQLLMEMEQAMMELMGPMNMQQGMMDY